MRCGQLARPAGVGGRCWVHLCSLLLHSGSTGCRDSSPWRIAQFRDHKVKARPQQSDIQLQSTDLKVTVMKAGLNWTLMTRREEETPVAASSVTVRVDSFPRPTQIGIRHALTLAALKNAAVDIKLMIINLGRIKSHLEVRPLSQSQRLSGPAVTAALAQKHRSRLQKPWSR